MTICLWTEKLACIQLHTLETSSQCALDSVDLFGYRHHLKSASAWSLQVSNLQTPLQASGTWVARLLAATVWINCFSKRGLPPCPIERIWAMTAMTLVITTWLRQTLGISTGLAFSRAFKMKCSGPLIWLIHSRMRPWVDFLHHKACVVSAGFQAAIMIWRGWVQHVQPPWKVACGHKHDHHPR